jgi:prepilin-type N-terminal cleavage/methylation domain-containing protein
MRRGVTLIETLAVLAIVAVMASLIFPVLGQAREQGSQTSCTNAMRQSFLAIKQYQVDWDGKDLGSVSEMGLPPQPILTVLPVLKQLSVCRRLPSERIPIARAYPYIFQAEDGPGGSEHSMWGRYIVEKGDGAIILLDLNHNSWAEPLESRFFTHTGLAINYGGAALRRAKSGDPNRMSWWE